MDASSFAVGGNVGSTKPVQKSGSVATGVGNLLAGLMMLAVIIGVIVVVVSTIIAGANSNQAAVDAINKKVPGEASYIAKTSMAEVVSNVAHGLRAHKDITYIEAHSSLYAGEKIEGIQVKIAPSICKADAAKSYVIYILDTTGGGYENSGTYLAYKSSTSRYVSGSYSNKALVPELVC